MSEIDGDLCGGCHNGGTCQVDRNNGSGVAVSCSCAGPWSGQNCESKFILRHAMILMKICVNDNLPYSLTIGLFEFFNT